jgi:hypothetical protein
MIVRRSTMAAALSLLFLSYACTNSDQRAASPVSPSAIALPSPISTDVRSFTWDCSRVVTSTGGWVFAPSTCGTNRQMSVSAGVGAISAAPANLRATVTGNTVRLDWSTVADEVRSYVIEAGSLPDAANLASVNTGTTAPALVVNDVPPGVYIGQYANYDNVIVTSTR